MSDLSPAYWQWINDTFFLADEITGGVGCWFYSKHSNVTPIFGVIPGNKLPSLVPGWNLVGVIGEQLIRKPENSGISGKIWTWNNSQKRYISIEDDFLPLHKKNKLFPVQGY